MASPALLSATASSPTPVLTQRRAAAARPAAPQALLAPPLCCASRMPAQALGPLGHLQFWAAAFKVGCLWHMFCWRRHPSRCSLMHVLLDCLYLNCVCECSALLRAGTTHSTKPVLLCPAAVAAVCKGAPSVSVANGFFPATCTNTPVGSSCAGQCLTGYTGTPAVTCQPDSSSTTGASWATSLTGSCGEYHASVQPQAAAFACCV